MSIRLIACGVLAMGVALFGSACGPTAEAQQATTTTEEQPEGQFCGGIAGLSCPEGYTCVDDPSDDCDPNQGGADCGGLCQKQPEESACGDPNRDYVSRNPNQCAAIRFFCEEGKVPFFDQCGCGCEPAP